MGALYGETIDIRSKFFRRLLDDQQILTQAIIMRLGTRRGLLWDDPEYGLAVSDYVNQGLTTESLAAIPAEVQAELTKDERIATVDVTATTTSTAQGAKLVLNLSISPKDSGPFEFVLSVSNLTVELMTRGAA